MIYVFANERYGRPFLDSVRQELLPAGLPVQVILSARPGRGSAPRQTAWGALRLRWKGWRRSRRFGVPLRLVDNVNAPAFVTAVAPGSLGLVAGFNQIFQAPAIRAFDTLVNFHPSLLPFYRGPVPSWWCLHHGETHSGFTLHRVVERIDAGEILHQEIVAIAPGMKPAELDAAIAERGAAVLGRFVRAWRSGEAWPVMRVEAGEVYRRHPDYLGFPPADR